MFEIIIVDQLFLDSKGTAGRSRRYSTHAVPRVGDRIVWYYDPAPLVKEVVWDFGGPNPITILVG
jgi:hypothetical protein